MSTPPEPISANLSPGWGSRIAQARKAIRWTQAELGKTLGVVKATVGRWELEQHSVSPAVWPTMAEALGVRVEWLRDGLGAMEQTTEGENIRYGKTMQQLKADLDVARRMEILDKWVQTQPDIDILGNKTIPELEQTMVQRKALKIPKMYTEETPPQFIDMDKQLDIIVNKTMSAVRKLAVNQISDSIKRLFQDMEEWPDEEVAILANTLRESLEKINRDRI